MATRGRRPKPTLLHELEGTLNVTKHAARVNEPAPIGNLNDPPTWLSAGQKEAWTYAMAHAPANLLRMIDRSMLVIWVEAEERHRIATIQQTALDRGNAMPLLTKGKDAPLVSPYLGIITKAALIMIKAANELGFSPASRPRLSAGDPVTDDKPADDPWTRLKLLQGGKATA